MAHPKDQVAAAIERAQADLDQALADLEKLPAFAPGTAVFFAAHALNNYLTVANGTIELLQASMQQHTDPQVRVWLDGLLHATNLKSHTVNQLMNNSAAQETKLKFERVDLPLLIQRVCVFYRRVADQKQIRIDFPASPDVPAVRTDRVAVAAVLDNLFSNAVKYSPHGKRILVGVRSDPKGVVCTIRDEGPGLRKEEIDRLFQPGVKLSAIPTGGEPSSGYGLAVARELVQKLGGEIWCESEPGKGASFSFRLPAA